MAILKPDNTVSEITIHYTDGRPDQRCPVIGLVDIEDQDERNAFNKASAEALVLVRKRMVEAFPERWGRVDEPVTMRERP